MVAEVNRISRLSSFFSGLKKHCRVFPFAVCFCLLVLPCRNAFSLSLISDDETETFLHNIIRPIFNAAGVPFNANKVFILNDPSLNAFVSDGNYLFIHTGTLMNADNVNELSGIIAHEAGHISGGHIVRQKLRLNQFQTLAAVSLIAAGATAAASGNGDAAMAVMLGSQSSLINTMAAYQMQEERSADESAVKYLEQTGQSPLGLKTFMKKISRLNRLSGYEEIPYFSTHPMNSERAAFFNQALDKSSGSTSSPYDAEFQIIKAKLSAFLLPTAQVLKKYPETDHTPAGRYARAILAYREGKLPQALKILDSLSLSQPDNPYFYELKGQFLFESGKIEEALKAYQKALQLRPDSPEIMLGWAQTAMEAPHGKTQLAKIITGLNQTQLKRPNLVAWQLLSRAYEENKQTAEMYYAAAQYSIGIRNFEAARRQIEAAEQADPPADLKLRLKDLKIKLNQSN